MKENPIKIEQAGREQAEIIVELARKTFVETYGEYNDPLNMEHYVNEHFADTVIREELEDAHSRLFIAYLDGEAVGFAKLRDNRTGKSLEGIRALEIQRIYVLKEYQGYHVGKALMEKIHEIAREGRYQTLWLQVWQQNLKALKFYQKAGFVVYETTGFQLGKELQQDFLMRYDLFYS